MKLFESKITKRLTEATQRKAEVVNPELIAFFGDQKDYEVFVEKNKKGTRYSKQIEHSPVKSYIDSKFMEFASESSLNEMKALLSKVNGISPLDAKTLARDNGVSF